MLAVKNALAAADAQLLVHCLVVDIKFLKGIFRKE